MALSDLVLKAKVNMALMRDPRVGALDIGVQCDNGVVTLIGDVDTEEECRAAGDIARQVDDVAGVRNKMTCGIGKQEEEAEMVTQKLLKKLDEEWNALPNQNALTQADYLRWALWMVYKFRLPETVPGDERHKLQAEAEEQALTKIAGYVNAPKALLALELWRQAEAVLQSPNRNAPEIDNAPLVATPVVEGDESKTATPART